MVSEPPPPPPPNRPTPLMMVGFSIVAAVIALVLILGYTSVDAVRPWCGSVFSGMDDFVRGTDLDVCESALTGRRNTLFLIGIPGGLLGVGVLIAGTLYRE